MKRRPLNNLVDPVEGKIGGPVDDIILPRHRKIHLSGSLVTSGSRRTSPSEPVPQEILAYLAEPVSVSWPQQGRCSAVLMLHGTRARYALKICQGDYRGSELKAEHAALLHFHHLNDSLVPVARPCRFLQEGDRYHLLTAWCPGEPLNQVLRTADRCQRLEIMAHMGHTLRAIHSRPITGVDWQACLNGQLAFAGHHLRNGHLDLSEFVVDGQPAAPDAVLGRLHRSMPSPGPVCALHGDFRPKNLLWSHGVRQISAVLDWAFCDVGDPYYDLAIALYYAKDQEERSCFLCSYGLPVVDESRLRYFEDLSNFLNV